MNNTANANIATLSTEPKPQTSEEVIAPRKFLIEQLEAGHSTDSYSPDPFSGGVVARGRRHNRS